MANLEHAEDDPKHVKMSSAKVSASAPATPHGLWALRGGDPGALPGLIPSFTDACSLLSAPYSCLVMDTHKRHIALSPMYLNKKRTGIQEELNTELLKYSESLKGVPLAYDNIRIVREKGDIYDDSGYVHLDIEANFVVFQPQRGQKLLGIVNKLGVNHAGCLVHGCFNASVPKPNLVSVDTWKEVGPRIGAELEFEVTQLDADTAGVLLIRGRLDRTWVQELMAMAESSEANVDEEQPEQLDTEPAPEPAPELAPEPAPEPAPAPSQDSPDDTPRKKKKKKKDKHKEEEREVAVTPTPPSQQGGGTPQELNGATDDANGEEAGERKKKKNKKEKRLKEEAEEVEISPTEVQGSDSSGYVSDKPNKKRRQEAGDDVITSSILNGDPETPKAKKKRKSDLQQAA